VPGSLVIEDTNDVFAPNTIQGAIDALSALLVPTVSPYYKLAALPDTEAELFEGKLVYNTTDHTLQVCTTPGEQELDTLTVTAGPVSKTGANDITITLNTEATVVEVNGGTLEVRAATITAAASANGNLTVKLDGADTTVAVVAGDTAAQVAGKITTAFAADAAWTVGNVDAVLTFTAKAVGPKAGAFSIGVAETGVTCTAGITLTTLGVIADTAAVVAGKIKTAVEAAITAETIAAWTVGLTDATLTFTKGVVGTASAPTAVDTDDTGVTFSAFARTNQGVASVWGALINAA
jgi:transcriptional antiterminator Rof (Rho-off)